jgi:hypothetical protein
MRDTFPFHESMTSATVNEEPTLGMVTVFWRELRARK